MTASSGSATVLPNDKVVISGTGTRRTVTFDPQDVGTANVTLTVLAPGDTPATVTIAVKATGAAPDPAGHYYSGAVDLSASLDVGDGYFLSISDEVNNPLLYKKGVSGAPIASFPAGFPGGETDFEGVTRFGDTVVWSGSHGNNRSGSDRPERRFLAFEKITGSGDGVDLEFKNSYTRLWAQWKAWDAANGHGLGANKLKFATATVPGLIPNAPNGFNVEGLTMAPGSSTTAWFGMRAPTITGDDGIERALILPVTNIDKLTSDAVDATFGAPILLDLGGRSIRDISKNAADQYLIEAGTGDTDDSLKNWALYTWDGDPSHDPKFVNALPTDEARIGAWEGIAEVPNPLVAGSKALLTADSGDTGLGKSYGQYVTIGEPVAGPAVVTGVTATAKPGALDIKWDAGAARRPLLRDGQDRRGRERPGSPAFVTGTSKTFEGLAAGTEYTVNVRARERRDPRGQRRGGEGHADPGRSHRDHDQRRASRAPTSPGSRRSSSRPCPSPARPGRCSSSGNGAAIRDARQPLRLPRRRRQGRDRRHRPVLAGHRAAAGEVHDRERGELHLVGLGRRPAVPRLQAADPARRDRLDHGRPRRRRPDHDQGQAARLHADAAVHRGPAGGRVRHSAQRRGDQGAARRRRSELAVRVGVLQRPGRGDVLDHGAGCRQAPDQRLGAELRARLRRGAHGRVPGDDRARRLAGRGSSGGHQAARRG